MCEREKNVQQCWRRCTSVFPIQLLNAIIEMQNTCPHAWKCKFRVFQRFHLQVWVLCGCVKPFFLIFENFENYFFLNFWYFWIIWYSQKNWKFWKFQKWLSFFECIKYNIFKKHLKHVAPMLKYCSIRKYRKLIKHDFKLGKICNYILKTMEIVPIIDFCY